MNALDRLVALWPQLAGYAFATIVAHIFISDLCRQLSRPLDHQGRLDRADPGGRLRGGALGMVERALYLATLQMGRPEFIGLWLLINAGSHWKSWAEGTRDKNGPLLLSGRALFKNFLIGNGLSILYAAVAFKAVTWLLAAKYELALAVPIALMLATLALAVWIARHHIPPTELPKPKNANGL